MKIGLTSVFVNNVKEAFEFYTEILGFKEKIFMEEADLAIVVSAEDIDGTALLLEPKGQPIADIYQKEIYNLKLPVIVFTIDDIQKEYERLTELGVVFLQKPTKIQGGFQAVFDDTCGNFIQLFQIIVN